MTLSAWIVSRAHIDVLVWALEQKGLAPDGMSLDDLGQMLWRENVKSIHARYSDTELNDDGYPGPNGFKAAWADEYTYTPPPEDWPDGKVISLVSCYSYQTCEHSGWEESQARQLVGYELYDASDNVTNTTGLLQALGGKGNDGDGPWGTDCGHWSHNEYGECPPDPNNVPAVENWLTKEVATS